MERRAWIVVVALVAGFGLADRASAQSSWPGANWRNAWESNWRAEMERRHAVHQQWMLNEGLRVRSMFPSALGGWGATVTTPWGSFSYGPGSYGPGAMSGLGDVSPPPDAPLDPVPFTPPAPLPEVEPMPPAPGAAPPSPAPPVIEFAPREELPRPVVPTPPTGPREF